VLPCADGFGERFDGLDPAVSVLFAVGEPAVLALPCIAIVGTRRATSLGRELARSLGRDLAELGVVVASGLALGVDAAAHIGALQGGGAPPLAVVGTGVDVPYPRTNAALWGAVVDCGLLLSEHPPGTTAEPHHFPQRNRVLAAVASAVVVVESHRVGGALITASLAADIGRPVSAVPGSVRNPAAEGTNQLLRDGASVVLDALDALVVAGVAPQRRARGPRGRAIQRAPGEPLTAPEQLVLDVLGEGATVDELVGRSGAALGAVVGALDQLDERGLVEPDGPRWRRSAHDLP
jgi:DNA processing protein